MRRGTNSTRPWRKPRYRTSASTRFGIITRPNRNGTSGRPWNTACGDAEWRQQMWGAIVALRGRYPEQLEALKEKWWTDESTVETLGALAVWRAELDETRQDPRDELAFQTQ